MKKRIFPIIMTLTALVLAILLGITFYQNQGLRSEAQNTARQQQDAQRQLTEANASLEEKDAGLADKEAYIAGQNAYIEELSAQLQELMEPSDPEDSKDSHSSAYEKDYPELYSQAQYDLLNGTDSGVSDKKVYLTFDDGPSNLTPEVLDLLDEYNAKATFFVVYQDDENAAEYLSEIVKRGHTLALHSYSHNYKKIYASVDAFLEDYDKVYQWVYEETGQRPTLFRFPGGSNNGTRSVTKEIKQEMARRGFLYYDWNVSSGDGSNATTTENIIDNICSNVGNFHFPVVLMHDGRGKNATLRALPTVLKKLKEKGYTFEALDETMEPVCF